MTVESNATVNARSGPDCLNNFNRFQSGLLVVCLVTVADGACDVPANAVTTTEQMSFCAAFCQPVQEELLCALARDVPNLNADAF